MVWVGRESDVSNIISRVIRSNISPSISHICTRQHIHINEVKPGRKFTSQIHKSVPPDNSREILLIA